MLLDSLIYPGMQRLAIVPDGAMAMLPFSALPLDGCHTQNGRPIASSLEVIITPSLSVFLSPKPRIPEASFSGDVALVADPVFDREDARVRVQSSKQRAFDETEIENVRYVAMLPRLMGTADEANAIARLAGPKRAYKALGFDASVATILGRKMLDYRIWHLATHGVFDETTPSFSGMVFSLVDSAGRPVYGYLKAHDIAILDLPTDLVVLSSCDSAAGENLSGEGVMSLSYAFLHAGVKQVVGSLWSADDNRSVGLMTDFYAGMLKNGEHPAEALRQAQLKAMNTPTTSAPYYWAGFEITSTGN
jgi:CHAT domain-containing protein